jgi:cell cycle arrest protein BUB3
MRSGEIPVPPDEGLSSVHFCPFNPGTLSTSAWSGSMRIYSVDSLSEVSFFTCPSPLLCSAWISADLLAAGSTDGPIFLSDGRSLLGHSDGVTSLSLLPSSSTLISSSWDRTVRLWDVRSDADTQTLSFHEKVILSEVCHSSTIIAHGDKSSVFIVDVRHPEAIERRVSSLGHQLRSACAAFPDPFGWAIGSIDGRIAIEYLGDLRRQAQRFSFSTTRHDSSQSVTLFPVNALCFHPATGVLTSGSCSGNIAFWDLTRKRKLAELQSPFGVAVAGLDYSGDGALLAAAFAYTWDQGEVEHPPDRLLLHEPSEQSVSAQSSERP